VIVPLNTTLEQELFALMRGASLECPACGEFVLHSAGAIVCPECGSRAEKRAVRAADEPVQLNSQAG
jgi:uncharacterized Zn finger protein (UPF0148 family)